MNKFFKFMAVAALALTSACALGQATATCGYFNQKPPDSFQGRSTATTYLVGTVAATGTPISPTASIFSDTACKTAVTQGTGVSLAANGFAQFYAPPGQYVIQWKNTGSGLGFLQSDGPSI